MKIAELVKTQQTWCAEIQPEARPLISAVLKGIHVMGSTKSFSFSGVVLGTTYQCLKILNSEENGVRQCQYPKIDQICKLEIAPKSSAIVTRNILTVIHRWSEDSDFSDAMYYRKIRRRSLEQILKTLNIPIRGDLKKALNYLSGEQ